MKFIYAISLIALNLCLVSAISPTTNSTRESLKVEERNKSRELFNATVEFPSVNGTKYVRDLNVTVDEAKVIKKLVEETNITVPVATNVARRLFGAKKPIAVKINREVVAFIENTTNSSATLELKIREEISTFDLKNSKVGLKDISHEEFKNATIVPVKIVKKESEGNSTLTVRIAVNETLPVVEHSNSTLTTTTVVVPVKERETEPKKVVIERKKPITVRIAEDGDDDAVEERTITNTTVVVPVKERESKPKQVITERKKPITVRIAEDGDEDVVGQRTITNTTVVVQVKKRETEPKKVVIERKKPITVRIAEDGDDDVVGQRTITNTTVVVQVKKRESKPKQVITERVKAINQ